MDNIFKNDNHGVVDDLTKIELNELIEYLRSLRGPEYYRDDNKKLQARIIKRKNSKNEKPVQQQSDKIRFNSAGIGRCRDPDHREAKSSAGNKTPETSGEMADFSTIESREKESGKQHVHSSGIPVYGNWKTFTMDDGLPGDRCYAVRIYGDRVFVGTHHGLAVYEDGKWKTYTTEDGLAHNGVASVDVSVATGDI